MNAMFQTSSYECQSGLNPIKSQNESSDAIYPVNILNLSQGSCTICLLQQRLGIFRRATSEQTGSDMTYKPMNHHGLDGLDSQPEYQVRQVENTGSSVEIKGKLETIQQSALILFNQSNMRNRDDKNAKSNTFQVVQNTKQLPQEWHAACARVPQYHSRRQRFSAPKDGPFCACHNILEIQASRNVQ